jgi:hypothetical protein
LFFDDLLIEILLSPRLINIQGDLLPGLRRQQVAFLRLPLPKSVSEGRRLWCIIFELIAHYDAKKPCCSGCSKAFFGVLRLSK